MAKFTTAYERNKWEALTEQARATTNRMMQGEATESDVTELHGIARQLGGFAQQAFEATVQALNVAAANDVAARVQGGEALSEEVIRQAIVDVAQTEGAELVETLEAIFVDALDRHTESIKQALDDSLDRKLEDKPTTDDLLSAVELSQEQLQERDRARNESASLAQTIDDHVRYYTDMQTLQFESLLDSKLHEYLQPEGTAEAFGDPGVSVSPSLVEAADTQSELVDKLIALLEQGKEDRNEVDDKREEEKADSWIRAVLRSSLSKSFSSAKDRGVGLTRGLLSLLGTYLTTSLLSGDLWNHIEEYLSIDKLKSYGTQLYDYMAGKARSLATFIQEKISGKAEESGVIGGISATWEAMTAEDANWWTPKGVAQSGLRSMRAYGGKEGASSEFIRSIAGTTEDPKDITVSSVLNSVGDLLFGRDEEESETTTSSSPAPAAPSSTSNVWTDANSSSFSLSPESTTTNNITTDNTSMNVESVEAPTHTSVEDPTSQPEETKTSSAASPSAVSAMPGISSFGFSSGVDSTLGLVNAGVLTG